MKKLWLFVAAALLVCSSAFAAEPVLQPGERLEKLQFPAATMQLKGWTKLGNSAVYTLAVKAGQHVKISFESRSKFAFLAIFDVNNNEDEAIFGTDEDGPSYATTIKQDTTLLLRPYYSKASPRRGLGAPYTIQIEPLATAPPPPAEPAQGKPSLFGP
ncbi:hypothetical protein [Oryzifoliimicrobium ureilyticus]|uniref:hypothetical protein n=1 Tax=Oryzifoliimicrobium ureilyticus TaxID=3113724 RepID=UPI00307633FD